MAETPAAGVAAEAGRGAQGASPGLIPASRTTDENRRFSLILLVSVFVLATCGLVYELLAGTIAT